jgi:hypothetical protein
VRKDKLGRPTLIGSRKQRNQNDDDTGTSPPNAHLVDEIEVSRTESIDEGTNDHDGPEAQDSLPLVCDEVFVEDGDGAEDELSSAEVDGKRDGL